MIDSQSADFAHVEEEDLRTAMKALAAVDFGSIPYILHAELPADGDVQPEHVEGDDRSYEKYLSSRPEVWETRAVQLALSLAEEYGCAIHIAHISASAAAEIVRKAKHRGAKVTAETCTQYLIFTAEKIPQGNTFFKCAPPIRSNTNRLQLWKALLSGTLL